MADKYVWLIILTLAQTIFLALRIMDKKNSKKQINNPNPCPGKGKVCIEHGKDIKGLETKMTDLDGDVKTLRRENREDHRQMFDKINGIKK